MDTHHARLEDLAAEQVGDAEPAGRTLVWLFLRRQSAELATAPAPVSAPERPLRDTRAPRPVDEPDPSGSDRLDGQVVDADERPVAGARVILGANPPRSIDSESDGSFAFTGLSARPYVLVAHAGPRGVAGPITVRASQAREPVILRLRPGASVSVTVVAADSKGPIARAVVELRGIDRQAATTNVAGVATLDGVAPGAYQVVAFAPGYARRSALIAASGGLTRVELELRRGAEVSGIVVGPHGAPVSGASVTYAGVSDWADEGDPRYDGVLTDARGRFSFAALPAGTFRFLARHEPDAPGRSDFLVLDGATPARGVQIRLEGGATVRGRVVDLKHQAVAAATVRGRAPGQRWERPIQVQTAGDGTFTLTGLPRRSVALVAFAEVGSSAEVNLDLALSSGPHEVTLTLDATEVIAGAVVSARGQPVEGAQVSASPARLEDRGSGEWLLRGEAADVSDANGRFRLHGLRAGTYLVRATPPMSVGAGRDALRRTVEAHAGDQDVRLVVEADGAIRGRILFDSGEVPVAFTVSLGAGATSPFGSPDGSFRLEAVPAGKHTLIVRGPGFDPKHVPEVTVASGDTADIGAITVRKGRTVSGRVTASDRPVAGALVRGGRMLLGSGSSAKVDPGVFGGGENTRETVTDDNGEFTLFGVGPSKLVIVAEKEDTGRSISLEVPPGADPVSGLELVLQGFGALEGTVTVKGKPAEDIIVNARAPSAASGFFGVTTGADGKYRFDRLAAGKYKVSAMTGGLSGMGFHAATTTVVADQTQRLDLMMDGGDVVLKVTPVPGAAKLRFASVSLASGPMEARTAHELETVLAALPGGYTAMSLSLAGSPATFSSLTPGDYTACVTPYPADVGDIGGARLYAEHEGAALRVFCKAIRLRTSPPEQSLQIEVEIADRPVAPAAPTKPRR